MSVKIRQELETAEVTVVTSAKRFGTVGQNVGDIITVLGYTVARLQGEQGLYYREICGSCEGTGYRPGYGYVDGGRCWPCGYHGLGKLVGRGSAEELIAVLRRRERERQRRALARRTKAENELRAYEDWASKHEDLMKIAHEVRVAEEAAADRYIYGPLLRELAYKAGHTILSDKQQALLTRLFAEETQALAEKAAARQASEHVGTVDQRVTISGTVVFSKAYDAGYSFHATFKTLYIIITAGGQTVKWYRSGWHEVEKGTTITVTATVTAHGEDPERGKFTQITRGRVSELTEPEPQADQLGEQASGEQTGEQVAELAPASLT